MTQRLFHGPQGIVPPHILDYLARNGDEEHRASALGTLALTEQLRHARERIRTDDDTGRRQVVPAAKHRTIFDAHHTQALPGAIVRVEGKAAVPDVFVNQAFDGLGTTYDFYSQVMGRWSIDGRGERLDASVHFGRRYDNAFWNGHEMVFGDGDGRVFRPFTACLEVIGHELSHGVVGSEAALTYADEPGALNESFADVLGVLVKQWKLGQAATDATWLVGEGLLGPAIHGVALRSLKAPGTAYDDRLLGKDPQPAHMKDYVRGPEDNGGVHVNSGIPNHAFYIAAMTLGGKAWERAGHVWYDALCNRLSRRSGFAATANATSAAARELYGASTEKVVREAWREVGVLAATSVPVAA
jgi:Zn-dependent metalloprotease